MRYIVALIIVIVALGQLEKAILAQAEEPTPTYPPPITPIPTPTSTPSPDSYSVAGRVLFQGQPPVPGNFEVGLCEITNDGNVCAYSVVPPAPKDEPDADGYFLIEDVPPGNYGRVFDFSYFFQIMPWHPNGYGEILFMVVDRNFNLGTLNWSDIPCDIIYDWRCGNMLALPVIGVE